MAIRHHLHGVHMHVSPGWSSALALVSAAALLCGAAVLASLMAPWG